PARELAVAREWDLQPHRGLSLRFSRAAETGQEEADITTCFLSILDGKLRDHVRARAGGRSRRGRLWPLVRDPRGLRDVPLLHGLLRRHLLLRLRLRGARRLTRRSGTRRQ